MRSVYNRAGYLFNDNRASDWKLLEETDIYGCSHCQAVIKKSDLKTGFGRCYTCDGHICYSCVVKLRTDVCEPFKALVDRELNRLYRQRQNALVLGI